MDRQEARGGRQREAGGPGDSTRGTFLLSDSRDVTSGCFACASSVAGSALSANCPPRPARCMLLCLPGRDQGRTQAHVSTSDPSPFPPRCAAASPHTPRRSPGRKVARCPRDQDPLPAPAAPAALQPSPGSALGGAWRRASLPCCHIVLRTAI